MFTFAEKLKQMSNIEHKDVGVSSLKGTPSKKIYIKTSTEAVYNPEGVTQEYINNHVDGSKIVDGTVTTSKIANNAVTMGKLDNVVQTEIQRGTQRAWNPRGAYNENTVYGVNDLVYYTDTNSSYISLQANNQGHNPAWQSTTGGWWMLVVGGDEINEIIDTFDELEDTIERNEAERTSKGSWDSTETYQKGNVVYHEPTDSSYMSTIDDNTTVPAGELNENWQLLISGSDVGRKDIVKYPIPRTGFTYALMPNIMYEFGYATSLSIDFNSVVMKDGELNEFQFSFLSGETATTLTVPESVVWTSTVSIEANMHYEVNILYNELSGVYHGIIVVWPLSEDEEDNNILQPDGEHGGHIEDNGGMDVTGGE